MRAQGDEPEALVAIDDRTVGRIGAREMHGAGADRMPAERPGAVVHDLELIDDVEMGAQHAVRRALGQERHGRVDALVLGPLDEVGAPRKMPVRELALDPRVLHFLVSLDQRHSVLLLPVESI